MQWTHSAILIVMVVIGGMGHRWGGAFGAAIWLVLEEFLRMHTDYWHWTMGMLLLVIVFVAPRGVAGLFTRVRSCRFFILNICTCALAVWWPTKICYCVIHVVICMH